MLPVVGILASIGVLLGLVFAGSEAKLAPGVRIAGIDVGGMRVDDARALLEGRAAKVANIPVTFTAEGHSWRVKPAQLGVEADWRAAVEAAQREGAGVGPLRGFKRLEVRFFGVQIEPRTQVYEGALKYELGRIARVVDAAPREASLRLRGLRPEVVPARTGRVLDRPAAMHAIVDALIGFSRAPVALPVRIQPPSVTADDLAPAAAQVRTALSAPVRLALGPTRWRLPRWRLAGLLELPHGGTSTVRIGGPGADHYFARLEKTVDRKPRDADFAVSGDGVRIVPDAPGLALDAPTTARALLAAALSPTNRVARLAVETAPAKRTTADARTMGITTRVSSYETIYGGDPNRIHNVQLVAHLVDKTLIAPGATFSFNGTTGERTADKGFLEAPVIINGELQTGLGGGICQVSTTVFNSAFEAGLKITERTNHALYISHYPLGRDATVNYPDLDLKFVNDTPHWLLLRTFVGSSSLVVNLYGAPLHRRVESSASPLVDTGPPPIKRTPDPTLEKGQTIVEDYGQPSRSTSVHRKVYAADGSLLHDDTWYSSYRSEPKLVRVGTKPKPKPPPTTTTTTTTDTTKTTTTGPAETTPTTTDTVPTSTAPVVP
ncbi:MAG: hypothetical protein QOE36_335 [Gaiellaceae bacterium]|nr:hypothetical protein [Gaiellaceae bacterium]